MRISDWSSDVCSSDLAARGGGRISRAGRVYRTVVVRSAADRHGHHRHPDIDRPVAGRCRLLALVRHPHRPARHHSVRRSEEHTSELQSLMRITYAVFCLKKKQTKTKHKKTRILTHTNNKQQ